MVSIRRVVSSEAHATLFAYRVAEQERYGVVGYGVESQGHLRITALIEKPEKPPSAFAERELYFFDQRVSEIAKTLRPSSRGEHEILDVAKHYLQDDELNLELLGRGAAWLENGTCDSLHENFTYIRQLEKTSGSQDWLL